MHYASWSIQFEAARFNQLICIVLIASARYDGKFIECERVTNFLALISNIIWNALPLLCCHVKIQCNVFNVCPVHSARWMACRAEITYTLWWMYNCTLIHIYMHIQCTNASTLLCTPLDICLALYKLYNTLNIPYQRVNLMCKIQTCHIQYFNFNLTGLINE